MTKAKLQRRLSLLQVVLYGLGVTIGAGIYALVGGTIQIAGVYAPLSFMVAAIVMILPAACFAELTGRLPFAAAEAHFVRAGLRSELLFTLVGIAVAIVGIISAAAIAHGAVSYLSTLIPVPSWLLLLVIICLSGLASSLSIVTSVTIAGVLTVIEMAGLALIVGSGFWADVDFLHHAAQAIPTSFSFDLWGAILGASVVAFFAFIGFEDMDSIAEETRSPQKTLSLGIFLTLGITTILYILVVLTILGTLSVEEASSSKAPLALVLERNSIFSGNIISVIASFATLNGIVVQLLMASRVIFGLAREKRLPSILSQLSEKTQTPINASIFSTALTLAFANFFQILILAEWTAVITLMIFILICLSLAFIRYRNEPAPSGTFRVYAWVPIGGAVACSVLLMSALI